MTAPPQSRRALNRGVEADLLAAADALQIEFWAWSPLARRILGWHAQAAGGATALVGWRSLGS